MDSSIDSQKEPLINGNEPWSTQKPTSPKLLKYEEMPTWYQDNEFILTGYRPSFNIYTHLLPALFAACLIFRADSLFTSAYPKASGLDRGLLIFYLICNVACFGLSAVYHTLINHSRACHTLFLKVDYVGILTLIFGDFITGEYVAFYCTPHLRNIYWPLVTLTGFFFLHPKFECKEYRILRLGVFTMLGMSSFVPLIHGTIYFGAAEFGERSGLYYYLGEGAVVAVAALVYATRFPESLAPGKFDIVFSSHQIFHVLTVGTVLLHCTGLYTAYQKIHFESRC
ncbi:HlyIII-domain-containing protein [Myriangium duriaei CBS 260.36]|uniref:HlyIII-domain-containing protein n=1 Tax=Myriangium duriaei CBS 260.36 TaxID=1168546 RepID=A0A9P4IZ59_9PEZI|nr:HlyIII-domain-containing protein [Myriangium duriaei CBS 260.36]